MVLKRIMLIMFILMGYQFSVPLTHVYGSIIKGHELLSIGKTDEAMEVAIEEIKNKPMQAASYELLGKVHFYSGRYQQAVEQLAKAYELEPWNNSRKAYLDFVKGTRDIVSRYETYESEHFELRLDSADRILKYYVLDVLETGLEVVGKELGFEPKQKIIVEIYRKREDFNFASTLTKEQIEASGAIGICKFNRNMIVSPRCLAFGFRWLDSLVHELTHYIILHVASPDIPLWLNEGIAKYYDTTWRSDKSLYLSPVFKNMLSKAIEKDEWIEFERMKYGMPNLKDNREVSLAFAEVSAGVDYIISEYGRGKLVELAREFMTSKNENKVFKKILGVSGNKFLEGLKEFIKKKNLKVTKGVVLDNFKLKGKDVNELDEYVGVEAKGFVRLGNKFRKKKMYPVALIEYKKALKLEPENAFVLNKLGKTYFDLGDIETAEENMKESLKYNPNAANAYTNLGDLLLSQNRLEEALEAYIQSNQINPFNPVIHKSMGIIHFNLGNREEALKEFEVTGLLAPYDVEIKTWRMHLDTKGENDQEKQ